MYAGAHCALCDELAAMKRAHPPMTSANSSALLLACSSEFVARSESTCARLLAVFSSSTPPS